MKRVNKGQSMAFVWIAVLVLIFFVAILYVALSKAHVEITDKFEGNLTGEYSTTFTKVKNFWYVWPIVFLGSAIIFMYIQSLNPYQSL